MDPERIVFLFLIAKVAVKINKNPSVIQSVTVIPDHAVPKKKMPFKAAAVTGFQFRSVYHPIVSSKGNDIFQPVFFQKLKVVFRTETFVRYDCHIFYTGFHDRLPECCDITDVSRNQPVISRHMT